MHATARSLLTLAAALTAGAAHSGCAARTDDLAAGGVEADLTAGAAAALTLNRPARAVLVDFDRTPGGAAIADGTAIDTLYQSSGVTLSALACAGTCVTAPAYARSAGRDSPNGVSLFPTGAPPFNAFYGAVEATFLTPTAHVSIDADAIRAVEGLGTPTARPWLEAYDASGAFLRRVFSPIVYGTPDWSAWHTLAIDAADPNAPNIARVRFSTQQIDPAVYSRFDNLRFTRGAPDSVVWEPSFSDANGWSLPRYPVMYADLDGDGRDDLCGRGAAGVLCAKSDGVSFAGLAVWQPMFSDAAGWNAPQYGATIRLADVDGDGKADVCGRGVEGVFCATSTSTGSAFSAATQWDASLSDAAGWNQPRYYTSIAFPDVDGDGKADLCARGSAGVLCARSTGSSFASLGVWQADFADGSGWSAPEYRTTIRFPDVNGDGKADLCARGSAGILCALSSGSLFGASSVWQPSFSDGAGWTAPRYYSTIGFPDLDRDGDADVCGRGGAGVYCALSNRSSFGLAALWNDRFSDANGWDAPRYYETVQYTDIDVDGRADLCGRGAAGLHCGLSDGGRFGNPSLWDDQLSDANGWDQPAYYRGITFVNSLTRPKRLCYRGVGGVICR